MPPHPQELKKVSGFILLTLIFLAFMLNVLFNIEGLDKATTGFLLLAGGLAVARLLL